MVAEWQFRTTGGVATVADGELRIRRHPWHALRNRLRALRSGPRRERASAVGAGIWLAFTTWTTWQTLAGRVGAAGYGPAVATLLLLGYLLLGYLWRLYGAGFRARTVPLDAVERVVVDHVDATVSVEGAAVGSDLDIDPVFREDYALAVDLPDETALERAAEVFALRGVEVVTEGEDPAEDPAPAERLEERTRTPTER